MFGSDQHDYWPLGTPLLVALILIAGFCTALVLFGVISYAYRKIGLHQNWLFAALAGSIVGSRINIPIARFPDRVGHEERDVVATGSGGACRWSPTPARRRSRSTWAAP